MSNFSDDPLYDRAKSDLEYDVYRDIYLLEPYTENELTELAMAALWGVERPAGTHERVASIHDRALDEYVQAHITDKIQKLRIEAEEDAAEAKADDQREMEMRFQGNWK